jgi:putative hemolysin
MALFFPAKYRARIAETQDDVIACQRLRYLAFIEQRGLAGGPDRRDQDDFDAVCRHVMVEEAQTGTLVCCFRFLPLNDGSQIARSYSARHYDLAKLATYPGRMVEMGRFCIHPAHRDPAILRVAWAAMSQYVDAEGVQMIFGCSSFHGVDAETYRDAFALLADKHLAPKRWLPRPKAPNVFRVARLLRFWRPDLKQALRKMPPLLRSYLAMGGWVSDHAVIDSELNTLHVFTGVEIDRVPAGRARLLRRAGS